jgi:hypothetical protein
MYWNSVRNEVKKEIRLLFINFYAALLLIAKIFIKNLFHENIIGGLLTGLSKRNFFNFTRYFLVVRM